MVYQKERKQKDLRSMYGSLAVGRAGSVLIVEVKHHPPPESHVLYHSGETGSTCCGIACYSPTVRETSPEMSLKALLFVGRRQSFRLV